MKTTKLMFALFGAATVAFSAWSAVPSVTINSVQQDYPNSNTVTVNYTVADGVTDDSYSVLFYSTINGIVSNVAVSPTAGGTALLRTGDHTVTWEAPANLLDTNAGFAAKVVARGGTSVESVADLKAYSDTTFATKSGMNTALTAATNTLASSTTSALATKADASALPTSVEGIYMIVDLKTGGVAYDRALSSAQFNTDEYKTTKMAFRKVPSGNYYVKVNNTTKAVAVMAKDYYIGVFPVTVAQFNLMNDASAEESAFAATADNMKPKTSVSWELLRGTGEIPATFGANISVGVISNLNARTGLTFDFPTESMWEVAARAMPAGDDSRVDWPWYYGPTSTDWLSYGFGGDTTERDMLGTTRNDRVVGSRIPNAWGLYDMYGNVWQCCLDGSKQGDNANGGTMSLTQTPNTTDTARRRVRGGAYYASAPYCSSWSRGRHTIGSGFGFRLAMIVQ